MILMLLLIGNLFLPFLSDGEISFSFWKYFDSTMEAVEVDIAVLLLLIFGAIIFLLQACNVIKDAKPVYYTLGYYLTYHIVLMISLIRNESFKYLSVGFYFGLIISLVVLILLIISNRLSNDSKTTNESPVRFDPKTGEPIYAKSKPKRFDPETGEPIY